MIMTIRRFHKERQPQSIEMQYPIDQEGLTLLSALTQIKRTKDATLTFGSGCRSSVCGSCAVRVNGKEVLACAYIVKDGDLIEPLGNMEVIKDLVVNHEAIERTNKQLKNAATTQTSQLQSPQEAAFFEKQSDCILCGACYSACPVLAYKPNFVGPYALTRSWRYVADSRQENGPSIIQAVQTDGIWDCTLCNECVPVCPQGIAPKQDIAMLQNKSGMMGFMNPQFGGGLDFSAPLF